MNETQAVLDFFAKPENLPLGLSVSELMDGIREKLNSDFWRSFQLRLSSQFGEDSNWHTQLTEDRNNAAMLVGLQCKPVGHQELFLFPMLEQQYLGGSWRIYFGLMWNTAPSPEQLALPAVAALKQKLADAGYKSNENFLAWQWTRLYPRRSDFLMRYSSKPDALIDETLTVFNSLLTEHHAQIGAANAALQSAPRSIPVSLDQLRRKRED